MFADGTLEGGVNDIGEAGTRISVAARFEDGVLARHETADEVELEAVDPPVPDGPPIGVDEVLAHADAHGRFQVLVRILQPLALTDRIVDQDHVSHPGQPLRE